MALIFFEHKGITEGAKYYDGDRMLRYRTRVKNCLHIGERVIELHDGNGSFLGGCVEDDTKAKKWNHSSFFRRFYMNGAEVAVMVGCDYRDGLELQNTSLMFDGDVHRLQYTVTEHNTPIFTYERHFFKRSRLTIYQEEQAPLSVLIASVVSMVCDTEPSDG